MAKEAIDTNPEIKDEFSQYQLPEENPIESNISSSSQGSILSDGSFESPNYVPGRLGWKLDSNGNFEAVNGTFSGSISGASLNIPDSTTANSFHVDSSGNAWWGANVATGYTGANAYILSTGAAVFKNVQIGGTTIQYVISNSGIFSYGDGSDGAATFNGGAVTAASLAGSTYTLTRDAYYTTLALSNSYTLNPGGYRIFCSQSATFGGGASGTVSRMGNTGTIGSAGGTNADAAGGAGASALADGYLKGASAGATGATADGTGSPPGPSSAGGTGTAENNCLGSNGVGGGTGGQGRDSIGGTSNGSVGGGGGTATASLVKLIANWHLATLLDISATGATVKFTNSGTAGGGGAGGYGQAVNGGAFGSGGGGGGGGGNGGIIAIYARTITIAAGAMVTATGGAGGAGGAGNPGSGDAFGGGSGGGGGGGGGNGGIIILVYNTLTNNGSITAAGGAGGAGGVGGAAPVSGRPGTDGVAGTTGSAGVIYQFQLSL